MADVNVSLLCPMNCKYLVSRRSKDHKRPLKYACKISHMDRIKLDIDDISGRPIKLLSCKRSEKV